MGDSDCIALLKSIDVDPWNQGKQAVWACADYVLRVGEEGMLVKSDHFFLLAHSQLNHGWLKQLCVERLGPIT